MRLILAIGACGSKKTMWAKGFTRTLRDAVRISPEDIYLMAMGYRAVTKESTEVIAITTESFIASALSKGLTVVLDSFFLTNIGFLNHIVDTFSEVAPIEYRVFDAVIHDLRMENESFAEKGLYYASPTEIEQQYNNLIAVRPVLNALERAKTITNFNKTLMSAED